MYDHLLHRGRKYFCHCCLHAFITEEIIQNQILGFKDCFNFNGK